MFIHDSMTREPITVGPDTSVHTARELMAEHHIRHLPVVDPDGKLVGIVTDRDIRTAQPSPFLEGHEGGEAMERFRTLAIRDIMTANPVTFSPDHTLEDALLLMQSMRVGAFPVIDKNRKLLGIISIRDLMRAFINVLGLGEPGILLGVLVEDKIGQMKKIVDVVAECKVSIGSVLVARHWEEGKRAVFPYLLTNNPGPVKKKLEALGFKMINPMEWSLENVPRTK